MAFKIFREEKRWDGLTQFKEIAFDTGSSIKVNPSHRKTNLIDQYDSFHFCFFLCFYFKKINPFSLIGQINLH